LSGQFPFLIGAAAFGWVLQQDPYYQAHFAGDGVTIEATAGHTRAAVGIRADYAT
jgi:hypothetical protein